MARDQELYLGFTHDKAALPVFYPGELSAIIFGPNGSGKDVRIIAPALQRMRTSILVVDPKGEQAAITSSHRAKFSEVIIINPFGLLTDTHPHLKSAGFNPIGRSDFCATNKNFNDLATGYGDFLVKIDGPEAHFAIGGKALVSALCMWDRMRNGPKASLANVRHLLTAQYGVEDEQPVGLFKTLVEMSESGIAAITSKTNRFLHPTNETRSVIATAIGQTGFLDSPQVSADLSKGAFDFSVMKRKLVTVYLILPADKLETHANWLRLVVGTALRDLMKTGPGPIRPLLVLNEVGNLGYLEPLATGMGIARGFGLQIMTVWQSLAQIKNIYKENFETFLGARGSLSSFAPQDWVTADYLSKLCGFRTELLASQNARPGQQQIDLTEQPQGFPLLRPEDLMRLPAGVLLNFLEPRLVQFPFLTHAPGYWETPFAGGLDPNPYYRPRNLRPQPHLEQRKALQDLMQRRNRGARP
jgi:type IV secretion system protein VirD4